MPKRKNSQPETQKSEMNNPHQRPPGRASRKEPPQQPPNPYHQYYMPPPQPCYYPPQPPMYYSPFEQFQPQGSEVTNPVLLQMFANNGVQQGVNFYGPFGSMYGYVPPQTEEKKIENVLRQLILHEKESKQSEEICKQKPPQSVSSNANDDVQKICHSSPLLEEITEDKSVQSPVTESREEISRNVKKKKKKTPSHKTFHFDQSRDRLSDDMLEMPDLKLTRDAAAKITKVLVKLHKDLSPTKQEFEKKEKFFNRLVGIIKGKWPGTYFLNSFLNNV